jgi:hypothetical protein
LVERGDITVMRKSRRPPQEVRVEEKGLLAEGLGMERPNKGIGGGINTSIAPAEVEEVLVKWEVMPAMAGVEMEEKGFSPTSLVWPLGMVVVEPADRGRESVGPGEWVVVETEEVETRLQERMG